MIVSWLTTNQCNLKCKHCYQDAGNRQETELTTAQAERLIEEISRAGFKIMIFSGGEPLMRPDIYHLVSCAVKAGLRPVFGTNGTLITREAAKQLKACGAAAMGISLDSLDEKKHNDFRGDSSAFSLTLEGIENCKEAGLPFQIHTTIMNWNSGEICDITDFAVSQGAIAHYLFFLIPVGRGKFLEETTLEVVEYEKLLQKIMAKQRDVSIDIKPTCAPQFIRIAEQMGIRTRFLQGCLAGLSYCVVSPMGTVRPCAYMTEEAGDVRQLPFDEIWNKSILFQTLRRRKYKGSCSICDFQKACGGCRARAGYYHDGDFMEEDSYCAYGMQLK
ncbi:putative heme d1 biosynthesis radical SAM protein NirJ2 [Sinanaerobacter chloroacetimidivorans]|jgi:putative heme d1 biosynthesis radical SAM protein NirJ2|uniref:Putative heme d1 biosynthesis radical SAM protein NirJ2 n=1 Tax=Sinanaerobacter chloroacetimidivorans TaxID=2818044 RepID=A0A8J8B073_9FIRM|nr:putative heme d1 biosynthesis radical SAM protein NirJ2 [Sinanaerobacter chloroacetimidivorans]MBR0597278.1 putative heme d1 biosynthesis radical SAM protein NirJ2 [Sinanaerobacter chloroacetimidivorans]